jgi:hypothetical protein
MPSCLGASKGMPCQQISSNLYYGMCQAKGEPVPYSGTLPSQVRPLRGYIFKPGKCQILT